MITINLTVNKKTYKTINQISCDSYRGPDNNTYFKSGTYIIIIPNIKGCDSVITLNLIINKFQLKINNDTAICAGNTIVLKGNNTSSITWDQGVVNNIPFTPLISNVYTAIGSDTNGCIDTAKVNVTVFDLPNVSIIPIDTVICQGEQFTLYTNFINVSTFQWKINGINLQNEVDNSMLSNKSGEYSVLVKSKDGCELTSSPLTIQLNSLPTINVGLDQEICLGDKIKLEAITSTNIVDWGNNVNNGDYITPKNDTIYTAKTVDKFGCRNQSSFNVHVKYPTSFIQNTSSYGPFTFNNITYSKSGQYIQVLKNSNGCDSILTLNLVIEKLGIQENDLNNVRVFPNPTFDGKVFIESQDPISTIIIYSSEGKILSEEVNSHIDLINFSNGVYFIDIKTNKNEKIRFKILKI